MVDTSKRELKRRDRAYYRRRQQNNVFAALTELFAEQAGSGAISKKELAEMLGKDPSQITRWLSSPSNLELDTISDMLLAMGAEMDHRVVRFSERSKENFAHPLIAPYLGAGPTQQVNIWIRLPQDGKAKAKLEATATASSTSTVAVRPSP
jgi:hypothetical protein